MHQDLSSSHTLDQMQAYLEGALSSEERLVVESRMKEDELYAFAMEQLREAIVEDAESPEQIKQWAPVVHTQFEKLANRPAKKRSLFFVLSTVAAGIAILLGVLWIFTQTNESALTHEELAEQYLLETVFEETITTMGGSSQQDQLHQALIKYKEGSNAYQGAIPICLKLLESPDSLSLRERTELRLMTAYMLMYSKESDRPLELLKRITEGEDSDYMIEAQWYQALLHIRRKEPKQAERLLEKIRDEGGQELGEKARELLAVIAN